MVGNSGNRGSDTSREGGGGGSYEAQNGWGDFKAARVRNARMLDGTYTSPGIGSPVQPGVPDVAPAGGLARRSGEGGALTGEADINKGGSDSMYTPPDAGAAGAPAGAALVPSAGLAPKGGK